MIRLKVGGARSVVDVDEAKQILGRFRKDLEQHGGCHTLDLSCHAWRVDSLIILEPIFLQIKENLINLKIDDIIASLPTDEGLATFVYLATVFSDAPALKFVNLNDNAIGTRGITGLLPLLSNASVTSIFLDNNGLAEADGESLRDLMTDPSIPRQLQRLSLNRNQMGSIGAEFIGELLGNPNVAGLQVFSYAGCRPLRKGTIKLCAGLKELSENCGASGTKLISLNLSDFGLGSGDEDDDPVFHLCDVLKNSPNLRKLYLRDGELEVSGLKRILDTLQESMAALTVLDLGAIGELGAPGGELLSDFLLSMGPTSHSLQELHLDTNELGDKGVTQVITGIAGACGALQVLNISENELVNIVPCLLCNPIPTLVKLIISENPKMKIGDDFLELHAMYEKVTVDSDLDDDSAGVDSEGDDDHDTIVDALADALDRSHL
jgi:Ran GTPase-activating protein (RanGAP) involved in mRNA processing and transport